MPLANVDGYWFVYDEDEEEEARIDLTDEDVAAFEESSELRIGDME